jgi:XK-related protein
METKHKPKLLIRESVLGRDEETDRLPKRLSCRWIDLVGCVLAIVAYVVDIGSDVYVAVYELSQERVLTAALILVFVVFPSAVVNVTGMWWWWEDRKSREVSAGVWALRIGACVLQLGPVMYYAEVLRHGASFRRSRSTETYLRMLETDRDATLLRMFEAFLESAPQLLIQGYLVGLAAWRRELNLGHPSTHALLVSLLLSLCSLSWALVAQHRCLRLVRQDKRNASTAGSLLQFLWRLLTLVARSLALVLFTLAFGFWVVLLVAGHFLLSTVWIALSQPLELGESSPAKVWILLVVALVHVFAPFNSAEGDTRWRYVGSYSFELVENVGMAVTCLLLPSFDFPCKLPVCASVPVFFLAGIAVMLVYYRWWHPNKRAVQYHAGGGTSLGANA